MDAGITSKKLTLSLKSTTLVGPATNLKRRPNRLSCTPLSLDDLRELLKEVVGHFLRCRLDQSRSDGRNRSTHLGVGLTVQLRLLVLLDESDSRGAAHESGRAFALHDERVGFRQHFVLEFQLADVTSFDACKSELEVRVV